MSTPAFFSRGIAAPRVVAQGAQHALDLWSLDRYALVRRELRGLLLGFAAFGKRQLRDGVLALTAIARKRDELGFLDAAATRPRRG
jgi:hypothetical protein